MQLTINGIPVDGQPGMTILEVARQHGIDIPTLCHVKDMAPVGACRLCVVEVEGYRNLVGSCHTPAAEGMVVQTHSPRVVEARRTLVELMLASHPDSCLVCGEANRCELRKLAAELGIGLPRFRTARRYHDIENESPYLVRDPSKCILCRRCITVCQNTSGQGLFSVAHRGFASKVVHGPDLPAGGEACRDCDACVSICPTGALSKPGGASRGDPRAALLVKE